MQTEGGIEGAPDGVLTEQGVAGAPGQDPGIGWPAESSGSTTPEAAVDAVDHLLDEVEQALSRLDDGSYGQCASCGEPIEETRLSDDPTARECATCQSSTAADQSQSSTGA